MKPPVFKHIIFLAAILSIYSYTHGQARNIYPGAPDEVIKKRAAQQDPPLWRIPLGPALIEHMELLSPDRLLVGLKKDFPGLPNLDYMLVDAAKGEIIWRFSRENDKGLYDPLLTLTDLLLFRVERGKDVSLLALDAQTGKAKWNVSMKGDKIMFMPVPAGSKVLAINPGVSAVELAALSLEDGKTIWQKTVQANNAALLPAPLISGEDIFIFYNGLGRISSKDGSSIFARQDLIFDQNCPPPQLEEGLLWAIHSENQLSSLDAATGKTNWTVSLPGSVRYTNIYPYGEKIYLRGISDSNSHTLYSLRRGSGQIQWTYTGQEPNISNFIESDNLLYFGTPTSLVALNSGDGKQVFSVPVTTTGRTFPIRIRKIGERIFYIGELIVAAFDSKTGKTIYRHGMTPASAELHLNGLDSATPNLKEELGRFTSRPTGTLSDFSTMEMERYQNLARTYSYRAESARSRGDSIGSSLYSARAKSAQSEARFQSTAAFAFSLVDLALAIRRIFIARAVKTSIERQELFRKSILSVYAQAETDDYVYRPNLEFLDAQDNFLTISVVHLLTGKRSGTYLSPQYWSYGLWNLIDFEKGVVYHSGIGMDPSLYQWSEARSYYPYSKARTINTFLIALPVKIPR